MENRKKVKKSELEKFAEGIKLKEGSYFYSACFEYDGNGYYASLTDDNGEDAVFDVYPLKNGKKMALTSLYNDYPVPLSRHNFLSCILDFIEDHFYIDVEDKNGEFDFWNV